MEAILLDLQGSGSLALFEPTAGQRSNVFGQMNLTLSDFSKLSQISLLTTSDIKDIRKCFYKYTKYLLRLPLWAKKAPYPCGTNLSVQLPRCRKEMRYIGSRLLVKAPLELFFVDHAFVLTYDCPYFFFLSVLVCFGFVCVSQNLLVSFPFLSLLLHQCCILWLWWATNICYYINRIQATLACVFIQSKALE